MDKIKKWLSVENNFNLIRDCLFILVLLGALLFGYCSLSHTLAAEVPDGFPELPDGKFSLSEGYVKHDFIVYDGTDYHALICKMSESATELQVKLNAASIVNDKMPLQTGPCYDICEYVLLDGTWAFSKQHYYNNPSEFSLSFRYSYDSLKSLVDSEQFLVYGTLPVTVRVSVSGDYVTINPNNSTEPDAPIDPMSVPLPNVAPLDGGADVLYLVYQETGIYRDAGIYLDCFNLIDSDVNPVLYENTENGTFYHSLNITQSGEKMRLIDRYQFVDGVWQQILLNNAPYRDSVYYNIVSRGSGSVTMSKYCDTLVSNTLYSSHDLMRGNGTLVPGGSGGSTTPDTGDGTDTPTDPTDPVTPVPPVNPDDPGEFTLSTLVTYVKDISTGLFNVADACIDFIIENPICLIGIILFIFVAGAGVTKTYTKGV